MANEKKYALEIVLRLLTVEKEMLDSLVEKSRLNRSDTIRQLIRDAFAKSS